jgi:hypothetical protein
MGARMEKEDDAKQSDSEGSWKAREKRKREGEKTGEKFKGEEISRNGLDFALEERKREKGEKRKAKENDG